MSARVAEDDTSGNRAELLPRALGRKRAWRRCVEADAVASPFDRKRHGHRVQRGLGHRGRHHEGGSGPDPGHKIADHRPFVPARDPALAGGERRVEAAVHHGRSHRAEAARTEVLCRRNEIRGGVVEEPGQRPFRPDRVHRAFDLVRVTDVADMMGSGDGGAFGDFRGRLFEQLRAAAADVNLRALGGEGLADLEAEAAPSAGHQDRLSGKRVLAKDIHTHQGAPPVNWAVSAIGGAKFVSIFTNSSKAVKVDEAKRERTLAGRDEAGRRESDRKSRGICAAPEARPPRRRARR